MKALPADLAAVCRRMKTERSVGLAVHERPDIDALGAAAGMLDLFAQLGVETRLHVDPDEFLPFEELLFPLGTVTRGLPPAGRPLYALDSGSLERLALPLASWDGFVVNIDHHHDNTRFGDVVYVRGEASSTSELVCDIARALGLRPSRQAAEALFAGISFDTGHFRHDSTSAATFETAAWLAGLGVGVTGVFSMLYEQGSVEALRLWARAVAGAQVVAGGRALVATLRRGDYAGRRRRRRRDRGHRRQPARRRRRGGRGPRQGTEPRAARARELALELPATSARSPRSGAAAVIAWPPASPATTAPRR